MPTIFARTELRAAGWMPCVFIVGRATAIAKSFPAAGRITDDEVVPR